MRQLILLSGLLLLATRGAAQISFDNILSLVDLTADMVNAAVGFNPSSMASMNRQMPEIYTDRPATRWIVEPHGLLVVPISDYARYASEGFGFGGEILTNISGPVYAGIHMVGATLDEARSDYTQPVDGQIIEFREKTASRILLSHGVVRFAPDVSGMFRPYVQGLFGVHWFYTNTRIRDRDANEIVDSFKESSHAVIGFGIQGGVQISPRNSPYFGFDVRVGYLANPSVEYMSYDEIPSGTTGYPVDYFETVSSPVQMITVQIGMFIRLFGMNS